MMVNRSLRLATRSLVTGPYNFVNGKKVSAVDPIGDIENTQPAKGGALCLVPSSGKNDVDAAVTSAWDAFKTWSQLSGAERGRYLTAVAQKVRDVHENIAEYEVLDTGKPIWEALADIKGCADVLEYYGGIAASIRGDHFQLPSGNFAIVRREPLGVVAGIGAWNYPFQVMTWKVAPALACGNTIVFKPSPLTPLSAIMLAELFTEVGLPDGVVNVIQGEGRTGELLCLHPKVAKVTFTGSVPTGKKIIKLCADGMKKVTMELGGKSALLVFDDCEIREAVKATILGNFLTQGEVCSNCTRIYVETSIYEPFVKELVRATKQMKIGDPFDPQTTVGATISEAHAKRVLACIEEARCQGAKVQCGGERVFPESEELQDGYYLSPCVITDCNEKMKIVQEEVFGSAVAVMPFETEEEAVRRANSSPYGLAAGVMTSNLARAHRIASKLEAGIVWINNYNVFPPEVPFGGYKQSGFGRENGLAAINSFTQEKTVYVEMNSQIDCPIYKP